MGSDWTLRARVVEEVWSVYFEEYDVNDCHDCVCGVEVWRCGDVEGKWIYKVVDT